MGQYNDNTSKNWRDVVHDYLFYETTEQPLKVTETASMDSVDISLLTTVDPEKHEFHVVALRDDASKPLLLGTYTCPIKAVWHHLIFTEIMGGVTYPALVTMENRFADMAEASFPASWKKDREPEVHEHLGKMMMETLFGGMPVHLA